MNVKNENGSKNCKEEETILPKNTTSIHGSRNNFDNQKNKSQKALR